ncbi:hypothetical protein BN1708_019713, partial [Verticillium longisporum]
LVWRQGLPLRSL